MGRLRLAMPSVIASGIDQRAQANAEGVRECVDSVKAGVARVPVLDAGQLLPRHLGPIREFRDAQLLSLPVLPQLASKDGSGRLGHVVCISHFGCEVNITWQIVTFGAQRSRIRPVHA